MRAVVNLAVQFTLVEERGKSKRALGHADHLVIGLIPPYKKQQRIHNLMKVFMLEAAPNQPAAANHSPDAVVVRAAAAVVHTHGAALPSSMLSREGRRRRRDARVLERLRMPARHADPTPPFRFHPGFLRWYAAGIQGIHVDPASFT